MTTTSTWRQGKTEFVKQFLEKNPRANAQAVIEAWTADGRAGTVSATLVNKMRAALGLAGNLRPKRKTNGRLASEKLPDKLQKQDPKPKKSAASVIATSASQVNGESAEPGTGKLGVRGRASFRLGMLEELESDIDRLLFKVMNIGGLSAIEDRLRQARRLLYGGFSANRH